MDYVPVTHPYCIGSVTIISDSEQVAFVTTPSGSFVVSSIPDARFETAQDAGILKRVNSFDEARAWWIAGAGMRMIKREFEG